MKVDDNVVCPKFTERTKKELGAEIGTVSTVSRIDSLVDKATKVDPQYADFLNLLKDSNDGVSLDEVFETLFNTQDEGELGPKSQAPQIFHEETIEEGLFVASKDNKEIILAGNTDDLFDNLTTKRFGKIIWDQSTGTLQSKFNIFSCDLFLVQHLNLLSNSSLHIDTLPSLPLGRQPQLRNY